MAEKKANEAIEIKAIEPKIMKVKIVGDSDLVLNRMNQPTIRALTDARKDKAKSLEKPDLMECIITSMHWLHGFPQPYTEEVFKETLASGENPPCITSTGLKRMMGDAVVRNKISTYKTGFDATVNVIGQNGILIPITFAEHFVDEMLMSPKKGAPVLVHLNRFTGWSATITLSYLENVYGTEEIINILNIGGFGLGVGSSRSSGFGRFHVEQAD